MTTRSRQQKDEAHAAAEDAWTLAKRRSAVSGLAERIRGTQRKPKSAARRSAERQSSLAALHRRLAAALERNTRPFVPARPDDSKYLPHQNYRECERRVAQGLVGQGYYKRVSADG